MGRSNDRPTVQMRILDARLGNEFPLPDYATPGSAGMDLRAMLEQDLTLAPGVTELIPTGFAMHLSDPGLGNQAASHPLLRSSPDLHTCPSRPPTYR